MYYSVNFSQFCDAFQNHDRSAQFSYEGKRVLFDYIEQLEDDTGHRVELDIIALCCEWEESDVEDIAANYNIDIEGMDSDEALAVVSEYLEENTQVAGQTPTGIVFQSF